jgi:ribosomal protein S18 acetylase RimI-like enzyme
MRWHLLRVARRDELVHPLEHSQLLAEQYGQMAGVLSYIIHGRACEILTLHVDDRHAGIGTALVEELKRLAREAGCARLWVITTNDNLEALRFYQRRGFRLTEIRAGAVDDSRARLKPEIPVTGEHGIPLRDELVLEQDL